MPVDEKKKPAYLRGLVTSRIALVDRGSNPGAEIVLYKRDATESPTPPAPTVPRSESPKPEEEPVTQATVYKQLQKLAAARMVDDPELTEQQAFVKVLDSSEGAALREKYNAAPVVPDTIEAIEAEEVPPLGGDRARRAAAALDKLVADTADRESISKSDAYDVALNTREGAELMSRYRDAIGDSAGSTEWKGLAKRLA